MKQITIGKPYIKECGEFTRLEAVIQGSDFEKVHYFEVQKEYGKYLCHERSDAFVVSLFYFALVNGYNMKCTVPMSEQLYYQLTRVLMPAMVKYHPELFQSFKIFAELDNLPIKNEKGVGAAVSGGVDSFYTIVSNLETEAKNHNVTHLLIANSYNIFRGDNDTRKRFSETVKHSKVIADDLGLPLITMYSNHSEFWFKYYQNIFCLKYASYPYALQKLFSVYYFSSGYEYSEFSVTTKDRDSSHYDAISAPQTCNENFSFVLFGGEASRNEKIIKIADHPVVQRRLQVCNLQQENCSVCEKCMRTQFSLYANKKLELFKDSFDIDKFYQNKDKTLIRMLSVRGAFDRDNLDAMQRNGISIPFKVKILGGIRRIYYLFRQVLKKIPFIFKLYNSIKKEDPNSELNIIERYNMDKEFAKSCDSGIV